MTRGELSRRLFFGGGLVLAAGWVSGVAVQAQHPNCNAVGAVCAPAAAHQVQTAYVAPVAVAAVVPVYTAVYNPAPPATADANADDTAAAIRELAAEIRVLRAELATLRTAGGGGPAPADKPGPPKVAALEVARQACAGCHTPAKADAKGGSFVLLADEAGTDWSPGLTPRDRVRIANRVRAGSMPPPPAKINEPYRSELAQWAAGAVPSPKK